MVLQHKGYKITAHNNIMFHATDANLLFSSGIDKCQCNKIMIYLLQNIFTMFSQFINIQHPEHFWYMCTLEPFDLV